MEKQIFEEKFERLYLEMGRKVAWNFVTQYNKIRNEGWRAEKLWENTKGVVRANLSYSRPKNKPLITKKPLTI